MIQQQQKSGFFFRSILFICCCEDLWKKDADTGTTTALIFVV